MAGVTIQATAAAAAAPMAIRVSLICCLPFFRNGDQQPGSEPEGAANSGRTAPMAASRPEQSIVAKQCSQSEDQLN
jgi:hypothetical protein